MCASRGIIENTKDSTIRFEEIAKQCSQTMIAIFTYLDINGHFFRPWTYWKENWQLLSWQNKMYLLLMGMVLRLRGLVTSILKRLSWNCYRLCMLPFFRSVGNRVTNSKPSLTFDDNNQNIRNEIKNELDKDNYWRKYIFSYL